MNDVYIDCNIILDWIIDRQSFSLYATELIDLIEKRKIKGFVSPLVLANCFYVIQKEKGRDMATPTAQLIVSANVIGNSLRQLLL